MPNMSPTKVPMPQQDPNVRNKNFEEVATGYTAEMAMEEATRCINCKNRPCMTGCPVNVPIPGFIEQVAAGNFEKAYEIITSENALPAICGRVCPQENQCEGKCIRGIKGESVSIGRLERFVADYHMAHGAKAELNIEIKPTKHGSDTLEQDVANLITEYHYTDACYVTSFSYGSLKKVKEVNPDIRTGYLMSVAYGQFYSLQYADAFSLNKVFVTSQVVNAAHQQGKQIFAWTVNSVSEVRSLCNLHVDSIITDDPVMVQNVVSRDSTSETLRSVLDYFIN